MYIFSLNIIKWWFFFFCIVCKKTTVNFNNIFFDYILNGYSGLCKRIRVWFKTFSSAEKNKLGTKCENTRSEEKTRRQVSRYSKPYVTFKHCHCKLLTITCDVIYVFFTCTAYLHLRSIRVTWQYIQISYFKNR